MTDEPRPLHAFAYDAFQQRAIDAIDRGVCVFVAAPTGSGKTAIADYVIATSLARRQRVIYTAPVKALSNQKFRDFTAHVPPPGIGPKGQDSPSANSQVVGIMTGDVTINPRAPVLIMTTEIYRNTLLENTERLKDCAWVIFDEIHYIDDPERGTVWEEALLFTPRSINILALSATIPNVEELAGWIREIHQRPVEVISESARPVPLHILFQCQNKILGTHTELKQQGYLGREDWGNFRSHMRPHARGRGGGRWKGRHTDRIAGQPVHTNRLPTLLTHLRQLDRLPCIFFTFGRRRTEEQAWEASGVPLLEDRERLELRALFHDLCERFGLSQDRSMQALGQLLDRGIAYHHAGMLPTAKEVIERCFTSRLIKVIFTTETFALGINMPARSVVIESVKKRLGPHVAPLRHREFAQMAGRAGRRGMDAEGFVYLPINPSTVAYHEVMRVLHSKPEPVHSRLNTAYATLLNLYRSHGRDLLELFPRTFFYYQTTGATREAGLTSMTHKLDLLQALGYLTPRGLTGKGELASWLYGYELLLSELYHDDALTGLDAPTLAVLLNAVVYEPRPGLRVPKEHRMVRRLEALCEPPLERIHRAERKFEIQPPSKTPSFQLATAMEAWFHGAEFSKLGRMCEVDDGEIVRYFRMTVQLLRQLIEAPAADEPLRQKARKALERINRDVVDAEQQLRLG